MIIDELVVALGFELDEDSKKEIDDFQVNMTGTIDLLKKVALGAVAVGGAITYMTKQMAESNDELGKNAQRIGIEVEELDALSHAMEIATGSSEGLGESMITYSRNLSEAMRGTGSAIEVLGMLGLDAHELSKDVAGSIGVIADRLKDFSKQEQIEFAEKLGIGNLQLLLDRGSDGIDQLTKEAIELGVVSEKQFKNSEKLNDSWARGLRVLKAFSRELGDLVSVELDAFIESFVAMNKDIKEFTRNVLSLIRDLGGLAQILKVVGITLASIFSLGLLLLIGQATTYVFAFVKAIDMAKVALITLKATAYAELLLIGALVAGVILIFEDLWTSLKGGKGLFNTLYQEFVGIEKYEAMIEELADLFFMLENGDWAGVFGRIFDALKSSFLDFIDVVKNNTPEWFGKILDESSFILDFFKFSKNANGLNQGAVSNVQTINNKNSQVARTFSPNVNINVAGSVTEENMNTLVSSFQEVLINTQKEVESEIVS